MNQSLLRIAALLLLCIGSRMGHADASANSAFVTALTNWVAWGGGGLGATGDPHFGQAVIPTSAVEVLEIAAGGLHNVALKSDGTVFCWGRNVEGQRFVPAGLRDIKQVGAGHVYSMALRTNGTVVHWGFDSYGLRPIPAAVTNVIAMAAGASHCLVLRADGRVIAWGWNGWGQTDVPAGLTNVVAISAGDALSAALKADGTVVAWGMQEARPPAGLNSVIQIACGSAHMLALRRDGTVRAWGNNSAASATNIPPGLNDVIQIEAGVGFSVALKADGSVVAWGRGETGGYFVGQTTVPADLGRVRRLRAGNYHVLAERGDPQTLLAADSDRDGLSNYAEQFLYETNPFHSDSDGDGYADGLELIYRSTPLSSTLFPALAWFDPSQLRRSEEGFHLAAIIPDNSEWILETSTNLLSWERFMSLSPPSRRHEFIDPTATNASRRFFRILR